MVRPQPTLYADLHPERWYAVAASRAVRAGRAIPVDVLGHRLVLWRTAAGALHAHHRFCPHMGASLANGAVVGDIWKDMDPTERRCLVADDKLQQRFRAYYKAHLPGGPPPAESEPATAAH